jgi:Domain of unknown function (DUF1905)
MEKAETFEVTALVWIWRAANPNVSAAWYFLTVDGQTTAEISYATLGQKGGFGSVKVGAQIGKTRWSTSLFPNKEAGGYMLPIKAAVRKAEHIAAGDEVTVILTVA